MLFDMTTLVLKWNILRNLSDAKDEPPLFFQYVLLLHHIGSKVAIFKKLLIQ